MDFSRVLINKGQAALQRGKQLTPTIIMTGPQKVENSRLSQGAQAFLDDHLVKIRERIIEEAARNLDDSNTAIEPMIIAEATKSFAPGDVVPIGARRVSTIQRLLEPVTGLTIVCAALAVVFGVLGLWADKANAAGWLDVAKVFAGAVVGSTGAGVVSSAKASSLHSR